MSKGDPVSFETFSSFKCQNLWSEQWKNEQSLISIFRRQLGAFGKTNSAAYLLAVSGDAFIMAIKSEY